MLKLQPGHFTISCTLLLFEGFSTSIGSGSSFLIGSTCSTGSFVILMFGFVFAFAFVFTGFTSSSMLLLLVEVMLVHLELHLPLIPLVQFVLLGLTP